MTTQSNLGLVWADTGGVTDPTDTKYSTGWIVEIPTFQNFNFVLQATTKNLLSIAEKGVFDWEANINYIAGAKTLRTGVWYTCITDHINQDPDLDTARNYWTLGNMLGVGARSALTSQLGFLLNTVNTRPSDTLWDGNDLSIQNGSPLLSLNTINAGTKNLLLGNVSGFAVVIDLGTAVTPDSRDISLVAPGTHKIYHEGNPPTQTEVGGTIPEAPENGEIYGRKNAGWIVVTTTVVSDEPPPPANGDGTGWYNLADGQFYIDIDDGDSSQWVPSNPPLIPSELWVSVLGGSVKGVLSGITAAVGDSSKAFATTEFIAEGFLPLSGGDIDGRLGVSAHLDLAEVSMYGLDGFTAMMNGQELIDCEYEGASTLFYNGEPRLETSQQGGNLLGNWYNATTSDNTLKENIFPVDGLSKVLKLHGIRWDWIEPENHLNEETVGFAAQDWQEAYPEDVTTIVGGEDDGKLQINKSLTSNKYMADMVEAMRSLAITNASLEARIDILEAKVQELEI